MQGDFTSRTSYNLGGISHGYHDTLTRNPTATGPDDEATVTEYQAGRSRVVARHGPVDVLRAMLTTWADDGGGNLR